MDQSHVTRQTVAVHRRYVVVFLLRTCRFSPSPPANSPLAWLWPISVMAVTWQQGN